MSDFISKSALLERLCRGDQSNMEDYYYNAIKDEPTVDVEPVKHGLWEEYDCFCCNSDGEPVIKAGSIFVCSICGREEKYREPYCHCGAKMDLEEEV